MWGVKNTQIEFENIWRRYWYYKLYISWDNSITHHYNPNCRYLLSYIQYSIFNSKSCWTLLRRFNLFIALVTCHLWPNEYNSLQPAKLKTSWELTYVSPMLRLMCLNVQPSMYIIDKDGSWCWYIVLTYTLYSHNDIVGIFLYFLCRHHLTLRVMSSLLLCQNA